jgi:Fuc2NAc and GlcNAc transferase
LAAGAGGILLAANGSTGLALTAWLLAAACFGFLLWNWPPAKIFLGDVGSGFLGYVLAVLAICSDQDGGVSIWTWLILLGVFVTDATITLMRRLLRHERLSEAHHSHAYQHATHLLCSHSKVTACVIAINVLGLIPLALVSELQPNTTLASTLIAVAFLGVLALGLSAGVEHKDE